MKTHLQLQIQIKKILKKELGINNKLLNLIVSKLMFYENM